MKLTARASLGFKRQKPSSKPSFGDSVINALAPPVTSKKKEALLWEDLPVPVPDLVILNNNLNAAVSDALTGNHTATASVKNAVKEWNAAFTLTANYITTLAAGDEEIIRQAGFVPTKTESQPRVKPGAATGFKATVNGSKGAIKAGTKKPVKNTKAYVFTALPEDATVVYNGNSMEITLDGKTIYITVDTHKEVEIYNLPSKTPYNISMYAVNSAGSGPATASQEVTPQ
jgi:hypothetical protein